MSMKDKHSKVKHLVALMQKVNGHDNLFMVIIHNWAVERFSNPLI